MRIGVDTGGTFTDVVARDSDGSIRIHKLLSTPTDPSVAIADGVRAVDSQANSPVVHGTTVATNALLERRGCKVALVTTDGFTALLTLGRQNRSQMYSLAPTGTAPLAVKALGVAERIGADGAVVADADVRAFDVASLADVDAVAICLLHSYANDEHERALAEHLRHRWGGYVSVSSELVREFREYERASTTVVNAYVGPLVSDYVRSLASRLPDAHVEVMESSGGVATLDEVSRAPVHTVLSGPAGGVVGAFAAASEAGYERVITFDMGGTSTDVSLCDGAPQLTYGASVDGHPLLIPTLEIDTVGAGGGSIAWVDDGGALRVGPRSAGASPGPAAYGLGGTHPTVTDAHVVLGTLHPERFLGGTMSLHPDAAFDAVGRVAGQIELGVAQTARGILAIADATMARAVNVICSRHGHDPRDFALVAFGGAGGLHACRLADRLGMRTVVVPRDPGVLSANGMLRAPRARFFTQTILSPLTDDALQSSMDALRARAQALGWKTYVDGFTVSLRYMGQSFDVDLPMQTAAELQVAFAAAHERLYGYRDVSRAIEVVAVRLRRVEAGEEWPTPAKRIQSQTARGSAEVDFGEGPVEASLVDRDGSDGIEGPAVVTEYSSTTVVPVGWRAEDVTQHIVLRRIS